MGARGDAKYPNKLLQKGERKKNPKLFGVKNAQTKIRLKKKKKSDLCVKELELFRSNIYDSYRNVKECSALKCYSYLTEGSFIENKAVFHVSVSACKTGLRAHTAMSSCCPRSQRTSTEGHVPPWISWKSKRFSCLDLNTARCPSGLAWEGGRENGVEILSRPVMVQGLESFVHRMPILPWPA